MTITCAVWYWRYYNILVELCENEEEAASFAAHLDNSGNGSVQGIQYSNGEFLDRNQWEAYREENKRVESSYRENTPTPMQATTTVNVPFGETERVIKVYGNVPEWLGK